MKLFESYKMKDITIKNRIMMPPMWLDACYNGDGVITYQHLSHYITRAMGGVGTIIVEATAVSKQGRISNGDLGIWNDEHIEGLKKLVTELKRYDVLCAIQLAHAGRKASDEPVTVAPSALAFNDSFGTPKEMTIDEIKETIELFKQAAIRAEKAGFDAVEIHGAHGYLINQFLSPLTNKRTDEYGENRFLFFEEIIKSVKEVFNGLVFVRVSAEEYDDAGLHVEDHIEFAKKFEKLGVDFIDVSSGGVVPMSYKPYTGYQLPFAKEIKKSVKIPVGAVGLITESDYAEEILQNNDADFILLGRELLRNPNWPIKAAVDNNIEIYAPKPLSRVYNTKTLSIK